MGLIENEFVKFMEKFDEHPFEMIIDGNKHMIGEGEPTFSIKVNKVPSVVDMLTSTSITLGEAYMNGDIEIEGDLYKALNMFLGQMSKFSTDQNKLKKLIFTSLSKKNQQKEVSSHYDIGNDFYSLWLDETMSYSCGYFKNEDDTLYQAQVNKVHHLLDKMHLKEGMTILDIGCGWGFLLIEAAKKYKVKGLGITLSHEQKAKFEERIKAEGLEDYLEVELMDYRDLPKTKRTFEEYPGDAWIKKYIFPGGVIPSLREIISDASDLRLYTLDVESLRRHYNKTLLCWNKNFQAHRDEVVKMFDERFARMWELYLCSCAATFWNGVIDLHQIIFTNDVNNDLPMTRWY